MKTKFIKSNLFYSILGFLLVILLWFIISSSLGNNKLIFPNPIDAIKYLFHLFTIKRTYISIAYSLIKMLVGYIISIILAIILGTLAGLFDSIKKILNPLMTILKALPTATLLFLFIVLAGFDNSPIYVVILVSFPILYESISGGIKSIPSTINESLMLEGGNHILCVFKVKIPLAMNYIFIGIASSFALAFKVEIMSEVLSGSTSYGIGCSIKTIQATQTDMSGIFAWSIIAVVILLMINLLSKLIIKKLK